jgi:sugar phosphate isomerase/epimerase
MFKTLGPGDIGIKGISLPEAIDLARETGFAGLSFSIREAAELAAERGAAHVRSLFDNARVLAGQWTLPVVWLGDEDQWRGGLKALPRFAALAQELGCPRTSIWCPSASDERAYGENHRWHVARLRPIAQILADHGCRLGIEFIGPKTLRVGHKYAFIHTLEGMMELVEAIGTGNVGLLLDAYHLYTSGGSANDLDGLANEDIVHVHVNDAPAGVPRDEQLDQVRCLPMETGVIDLPGFMRKLSQIGYDGPVMPEPFSERVNAISDPLEAAQLTAKHMDAMWRAAGLA